MIFSRIKSKYIYNAVFDDVRACEFNGKHLALVLKKNKDKRTCIVMPFTSNPNGNGANKIKLGQIHTLPSSLKKNITYAVFNQIRTLHYSRFIELKEGNNIIESKIDDHVFYHLLNLGISDMLYEADQDDKILLLKTMYEKECVNKAKDLAYSILRLQKDEFVSGEDIMSIKKQINLIIKDIPYFLEQKFIDDGIGDILDESKNAL